ncbi:MAG TPA: hypothetical protein VGF44_04390 [Terriglobales bacterium]|jgi:hypothetical protein
MANRLNNWRFLTSVGCLLLAAGILVDLFVHAAPGMPNNLSHALTGFFCGMSVVFLLRAGWLAGRLRRNKNIPPLQP